MPDVAVAAILVDALHNGLDRINLIRAHHHELLLAGDEHHVAADHLAQRAFGEEGLGEAVEVGDLLVVFGGGLIDGQEALVRVEREVTAVVVGEVPRIAAVADDEQLQETEQRFGVAVAGVVLVLDDLFHRPARVDAERFQLDLHAGDAVDENEHIVAVVAVIRVDAKLVDDLEGVFTPVLDVDQGVVQRRAVVAGEAVALAQGAGRGENVGGDDFLQQARELAVRQTDPVQGLELLAEVFLQGRAIADIRAVGVFEVAQLSYEILFNLVFFCCH